jgi:ribosomal peptide maturation radical SAM protein 1
MKIYKKSKPITPQIILVNMPFGPLFTPSIGLSLLLSNLEQDEISSQIKYFNIKFADLIGDELYQYFAEGHPATIALLGEWLFSSYRVEIKSFDANNYLDVVLMPILKKASVPENLGFTSISDILSAILNAKNLIPSFIEQCLTEVTDLKPLIVGFTSVFQQHSASLILAKKIKDKLPNTTIIFGGANCESVMGVETIKQFSFVDIVVSGEGDKIISSIVQRIYNGLPYDDLPGVYTQNNINDNILPLENAPVIENLNDLPYPNYKDYFLQWEERLVKSLSIPKLLFETSRGCWWGEKNHCTFCGLNGNGMAFRSKTADRAIKELLKLTNEHPGYSVAVVDNILDMKYFDSFIPMLAEKTLNIDLFYEVKANLKKEHLVLLKRAGINAIQPGIESFSNQVLQIMNKGVSGLQNIQLLKWCLELEIDVSWSILYGFPKESPFEYEEMSTLVSLFDHLQPPMGCFSIRLDRYSPNFDSAKDHGFTKVRPAKAYNFIYSDLPLESLFNLAYYFDYNYLDNRKILEYTTQLRENVRNWIEKKEVSILTMIDYDEYLVIFDTRSISRKSILVVNSLARQIYLYCDRIHSLDSILRKFNMFSKEKIAEVLSDLCFYKILLNQNNLYLSLAVERQKHSDLEAFNLFIKKIITNNKTDLNVRYYDV